MGLGMLSLPDVVKEMSDAEKQEMEEVTHWALVKTRLPLVVGSGYHARWCRDEMSFMLEPACVLPRLNQLVGSRRERPLSSHEWPSWWEWDLGLSVHLMKRMVDRDFTEVAPAYA